MGRNKPQSNRPPIPEELEGEALLEWGRICKALRKLKKLDTADVGIMTLHCELWSVFSIAKKGLAKEGPVIEFPNGTRGPSPFSLPVKEYGRILIGTFHKLGLTPAARMKIKIEEPEKALEF